MQAARLSLSVALLAVTCSPTAMGLRSHGASLNHVRSLQHQSQSLMQPEGVPKVVPGRFYVFIAHEKTGANLMSALCNVTALTLSWGKEPCVWCDRVIGPQRETGGDPACVLRPVSPWTSNLPAKKAIRLPRFTIVSSMLGGEFARLRQHAPNYRAVHMIQDPVKIVISGYQYDASLDTPADARMRPDADVMDINGQSIMDGLKKEAAAVFPSIQAMYKVHLRAQDDDRVLALSEEPFEIDYNGTLTRLFDHMFENIDLKQMQRLVDQAEVGNEPQMPKDVLSQSAPVAAAKAANRTALEKAWGDLARTDGDRFIRKIIDIAGNMGYQGAGEERGSSQAGVNHEDTAGDPEPTSGRR